MLGPLSVRQGEDTVALPQSKKTRALLAYLAVTKRRHRRERLCEMFWDMPDDPRGSLRWSLSKLRPIAGDALEADRDSVGFRNDAFDLDYDRLRAFSATLEQCSVPDLERVAALFRGRFLDDLSLPRCAEYEAWRVALENETDLVHMRARRALIERLRDEPGRALAHAHALLAIDPDDSALAKEIHSLAERSRRHAAAPDAASPAPHTNHGEPPSAALGVPQRTTQQIRYCATRDGVQIAYAVTGQGTPILKAANYMSHLQYDWESPIWRHWIEGLSAQNTLIRYDERGNGLSDWDVSDVSFEAMVGDLESVADAAKLERFALLGISQGCALSIAYALRHPERVSHLVLYGGYAQGWRSRGKPDEIAQREAMITLIRQGWGQNNPAFRQLFTSLFIPGATAEQMDWFNELQRRSVAPEMAAKLQESFGTIDVSRDLPKIATPTLVLHARSDAIAPLKAGQALAAGIPDAKFVLLDSGNHVLLAHEPAFAQLLDEVRRFIAEQP